MSTKPAVAGPIDDCSPSDQARDLFSLISYDLAIGRCRVEVVPELGKRDSHQLPALLQQWSVPISGVLWLLSVRS